PTAPPSAVPSATPSPDPEMRLNLNTASAAELQTLPGVGPVLAERILALRAELGVFGSIWQLIYVDGISYAMITDWRERLTVEATP
ncbi:MAG: ComEA family DNA-binding protein, partial [Anaerolineae bacterium]|nr:ComEA family DNA-binding protein [Anaerolineae bacterium]